MATAETFTKFIDIRKGFEASVSAQADFKLAPEAKPSLLEPKIIEFGALTRPAIDRLYPVSESVDTHLSDFKKVLTAEQLATLQANGVLKNEELSEDPMQRIEFIQHVYDNIHTNTDALLEVSGNLDIDGADAITALQLVAVRTMEEVYAQFDGIEAIEAEVAQEKASLVHEGIAFYELPSKDAGDLSLWDNNKDMAAAAVRIFGEKAVLKDRKDRLSARSLKKYLRAIEPDQLKNIYGQLEGYVESAYFGEPNFSLDTTGPVTDVNLDDLPSCLSWQRMSFGKESALSNDRRQRTYTSLNIGEMENRMAIVEGTTDIKIGRIARDSRIHLSHNSSADIDVLEGHVDMTAYSVSFNPSVFIGHADVDPQLKPANTPGYSGDHWRGRVFMGNGDGLAVFDNKKEYNHLVHFNAENQWNSHDPNFFAMPENFRRVDLEKLDMAHYQEIPTTGKSEEKSRILLPDAEDKVPYRSFVIDDPIRKTKRFFTIVRLDTVELASNIRKDEDLGVPRTGYALFEMDFEKGKSKFHFAFRNGKDQHDHRDGTDVISDFDAPGMGRTGEPHTWDEDFGKSKPARDLPFAVGKDKRKPWEREPLHFNQARLFSREK